MQLSERILGKITRGEALDVAAIAEPTGDGETFRLKPGAFVEKKDYWDSGSGRAIWSIGKDKEGAVFASFDTRYYQHPEGVYECLWLR
jgi:hypothetical protein